MRIHSLNKLEYPRVVDTLTGYTVTYAGRSMAEELRPLTDAAVISKRLQETEEARQLLAKGGHPPLPSMEGLEWIMSLLGTGYVMTEQDFGQLAQFARSCGQMRQYMSSKQTEAPSVAAMRLRCMI